MILDYITPVEPVPESGYAAFKRKFHPVTYAPQVYAPLSRRLGWEGGDGSLDLATLCLREN